MTDNFPRYLNSLDLKDRECFEALCFHRWSSSANPQMLLAEAPSIGQKSVASILVEKTYANSKQSIQNAYETPDASGAEIFVRALVPFLTGPGRVPALISATGPEGTFDLYECNIQQELGGPLNSSFTGPYSCGLTWNTYHFFEDAFGSGSSIEISVDHLTNLGVEFAKWLYADRIS